MCGIAGIITQRGVSIENKTIIETMLRTLSHRGPDDLGIKIIEGGTILGHRRLAIIDREKAKQPMLSDDERYILIYNGEIYNYLELRQELIQKGICFNTFSDTEVLLHMLILEKEACLRRLNGMFALLFYDRQERSWLAARDPFGIKPFYYVSGFRDFLFASEIKALLKHPNVKVIRDEESLHDYLTFQFCLGKKTLFQNIIKLNPGTYLKGVNDEIGKQTTFWNIHYEIDNFQTEEYFLDTLRGFLEDSVRLQLRSEVALGAYLSGGLDSSIISSISAKYLNASIPVFHGKFKEGSQYDESNFAKLLAKKIPLSYNEIILNENDFVNQLSDLIYILDEPIAGPGSFSQFMVSKLAKENVTVVLGGQGGDEIFGGYIRYLIGYLEQTLKGSILEKNEEGKQLVNLESIIPQLPLIKNYRPLLSYFWQDGLFDNMDARYFRLIDRGQGLRSILSSEVLNLYNREKIFNRFQKIFNYPDTKSYINKMTHFDQKTFLPALLQVEDRVSMAVSLESRVPFLDTRIIDLVAKMPPSIKFRGGQTKYILKKAVKNILPNEIIDRKNKMGFPVPLVKWVKKGVVREFVADVLLSQRSINRGIFTPKSLNFLIDSQSVGGRLLWGALSLELWHRRFIDGDMR